MKTHRIFTINPGSTSTKIALFEEDQVVFSETVSHDASQLAAFESLPEQFSYRKATMMSSLEKKRISLEETDAFVGRGGGLLSMRGGVYEIDSLLLQHAREGANGVDHPANLGPGLAYELAQQYQSRAFVVNPPDVDELQDLARMTGIRGVYRNVHLHALNLKETAIRHARTMGKKYEDCDFVVCHIGGGISVSAHQKGRMIDGYDIVGGEGPMAPTRCGAVPVSGLLDYGKDQKNPSDLRSLCTKSGGFVSHLGTSDALEVIRRAEEGDRYAGLVWDTMIYQIEKSIGAMAAALHGRIDGILLGGGMVYSSDLVDQIRRACQWIAPVSAYPGEFEMEAMAAGAIRVLKGEDQAQIYTGIPVFQGFSFVK